MMNFIICEDDKNIVNKVLDIIKEYMLEKKINYEIGLVKDSTEGVINHVKQNKDKKNIYILDIELKNNQNGMTLAQDIRKHDVDGEIIFLTSHATMVMYVFKYKLKALDFIDKNDNIKERLISNLDNILDLLSNQKLNEKFIEVKSGARTYRLNFDEIVTIQTTRINGKLRVSTINFQMEFYGYLKDIIKSLDDRFCRTHRSCIVNRNHISIINKEKYNLYILMSNGEKSLLSRNYVKGLESKDD